MRLMKLSQLMVIAISGLAATMNVHAESAAPVAKVNGVAIPQSRLEFIIKGLATQGQPDSPETRKAVREDLVKQEVVSQEAVRKGLDRDPDIATQLELARQQVLIRAFQNDFIKNHKISDEELHKEYDLVKTQMGDKEYKARHILVGSEEEAKDIIARLKKGAKFDKLAQEKSTDAGTKGKGGELDWSPAGNFVQPFAEALTKLEKGKTTELPVHTAFGWHVIRLDDVRPLKAPPFEEVKQNMQQRILQRQFSTIVNDLRAKAKVE